ncbi:MAG: bifunctional demethylmenaquinone methyltransferase/2-methoxy-6-polyprenyl-1,4-benzoquinol methylase UbiE [Planctomycetes bacterium]|nr:bifunctional demethylmenaquinone methyltransferase/2-methoxy-6-polyprenyl-1,4-benzoquinol methylase UbiE [Planctomycetota bacterium]
MICDKSQISGTFDEISGSYDIVNRLISFGIDRSWRKRLVSYIPDDEGLRVLDLATGTGDVAIEAIKTKSNIASVAGVDLSEKMMEIGKKKVEAAGAGNKVIFKKGDLLSLPFSNGSFDCVTMAFGLRNAVDTTKCISEISRVLKAGGKALVLEFSLPRNFLFRAAYLFYFKYILPIAGGAISGNMKAYQYLNSTVVSFASPEKVAAMMAEAYLEVKMESLSLGIVTIYIATKSH